MNFKFTVNTVVTAIAAAASAFGAAYSAANLDNTVTKGEWVTIAWAIGTAVAAALLHDSATTTTTTTKTEAMSETATNVGTPASSSVKTIVK
jgi:hypothetical protein